MRPRSLLCAVCLFGALAAVACGSDDDSASNNGGASGHSGTGGASNGGRSGNSGAGKANGGADNNGEAGMAGAGAAVGVGGEGGQAGQGTVVETCTHFTAFVHSIIKDDTNDQSVPRTVNDLTFCPDATDPAAFNDLF